MPIKDWNPKHVERLTKQAAARGVKKATFAVEREVDRLIRVPGFLGFGSQKRGAIKEGKTPGRSRPGEPPRMQTGHLRDNIVREFLDEGLVGRVGPSVAAPYGKFLELGWVHTSGTNVAARPFLRPAFNKVTAKAEKFFRNQGP